MKLEIDGDALQETISPETIERAIRSLADRDDGFVILSTHEMTYIQVAGNPQTGFVLEYQENAPEQHYSCENPNLTEDEVIGVFQHFLAQDDEWKQCVPWTSAWKQRSSKPPQPTGGFGRMAIMIITLIVLAALAWVVIQAS